MSDTILGGDFTVYYTNDTGGDKQIIWTGAATDTRTVNELYKAIQDLFDDDTAGTGDHMDEGIPIKGLTPTLYEIGRIELNDSEPWFIDPGTIEHLKTGGLNSSSWTRTVGSATGIVKMGYTAGGTPPSASDVGLTITTDTDNDSGKILYVDTTNLEIWIRPDSSAAANSFDNSPNAGDTFSIATSSATGTQTGAATTGEYIWSNIYSLGTIKDNTEMLIYQNGSSLTQWWGTGHIDVLVMTTSEGTLIDEGYLSVYARQYSKLFDHFIADVSGGGRTPIPLATSNDTNNTTGYSTIALTGVSGTFNTGNYIYVGASWAAASAKGEITDVSGSNLSYYLLGDLTDFADTNSITEWTGTANDATATVSGAPTATTSGPTDSLGITITFSGAITQDLSNGNGSRPYDVTVDCNSNSLAIVYERLKYITRRGETSDIDTGTTGLTITGEEYIAVGEQYFTITAGTGSLTEGNTVTGDTSSASATIVSNHSDTAIVVSDITGTFSDTEGITEGSNTATITAIETILPAKTSPFGTFAGGKFFGARGVWLANVPGSEASNYQLIDSAGVEQVPPTTIAIEVTGLVSGDRVTIFESTGSGSTSVNKSQFTSGVGNTQGASSFVVNATIPNDTPSSGYIRVVDAGDNTINRETRYQYDSWSGTTFTLNVSNTLDRAYDNGVDTAYVGYIDTTSGGTSVSTSVQYVSNHYVVASVRQYAGAGSSILPFRITGEITTSGYSTTAIRTSDDIVE